MPRDPARAIVAARPSQEGRTAAQALGSLPCSPPAPGPAGLLVHRHDERLAAMHNALVRGELRRDGDDWLFVPAKVVEPAGSGRPLDMIGTLRRARRATRAHLDRRGLPRPKVAWTEFQALAAAASRTGG
ncbi:hypothetical protein [Nonomuraea sp. NPDC050691]|uniref:hypothetical protein n=1 Tax=Nonomuraea sp. NPDC050691 TaxID=3155661 RepID=UPI0033E009D4